MAAEGTAARGTTSGSSDCQATPTTTRAVPTTRTVTSRGIARSAPVATSTDAATEATADTATAQPISRWRRAWLTTTPTGSASTMNGRDIAAGARDTTIAASPRSVSSHCTPTTWTHTPIAFTSCAPISSRKSRTRNAAPGPAGAAPWRPDSRPISHHPLELK